MSVRIYALYFRLLFVQFYHCLCFVTGSCIQITVMFYFCEKVLIIPLNEFRETEPIFLYNTLQFVRRKQCGRLKIFF
jgi:hypothetical protein